MYFIIEDVELLETYNKYSVSNGVKKELNCEPIYNKKFLKTKVRIITITTTRTILIFHLKTSWCSHCVIVAIIVTQNLLSWIQDGRRKVWHDGIFDFKTSKKKSSETLEKTKVLQS